MTKSIKQSRSKEFLTEAEDVLAALGKGLLELEQAFKEGKIDAALVNSIFRSAHTLKGISSVFDFNEMIEVSHAIEDKLDAIRHGRITLTDEILGSIMWGHGLLVRMASSETEDDDFSIELKSLFAFFDSTLPDKKDSLDEDFIDRELVERLTDYEEYRLVENIKGASDIYLFEANFPIVCFDKDYEVLSALINTLGELIATLPSTEKHPDDVVPVAMLFGTSLSKSRLYKSFKKSLRPRLKLLFEQSSDKETAGAPKALTMQKMLNASPGGPPSAGPIESLRSATDTVRVNISKLDSAMNILGELGLVRAGISKLAADLKRELPYSAYGMELARIEKHFDRKFSDLRDGLLDIRMVQIGQLFSRYETLVSRLSRKTGKEVRVSTFGIDTEIDKLMVEELSDPIMHIIRNIVDHAIEEPDEREGAGKDRVGTITLGAYQKGSQVVLEISDDGIGIDPEKIKTIAIKRGFLTTEAAASLTRTELIDLIFLPGFTTADSVSEVSGRGVGLDVVKENIARLSGVIEIDTTKDRGTRIILTIPITLAIIQAIIVEDAGERYALPLNNVTEVVTVRPEDIFYEEGHEVITAGDRTVPFIRLAALMNKKFTSNTKVLHAIVAGSAEHRICIASERIVEQLDVVIKPLSKAIKVPWIAGAADLGLGEDGTTLVLDISGIMELATMDKKVRHTEQAEAG